MTTVSGDNINNLAIEGNFDDCQQIVKQAFSDQSFLPAGYQLVAVNSINWARIMAQIVYYFYAALKFQNKFPIPTPISFSVPTGNFGDIYAGYLAKKMGLPIRQLVIATNSNDILHRFISSNRYFKNTLQASLSPSMDIMVSSNFERFLYDLFQGDTQRVTSFVTGLSSVVQQVTPQEWEQARAQFSSYGVDDASTVATIKSVFKNSGFLLDPHTATGVKAALVCNTDPAVVMIILGTAHPVKFAAAIEQAGLTVPALPPHMADLFTKKEHYTVLGNSLQAVQKHILANLKK
jgi:threonine synthase